MTVNETPDNAQTSIEAALQSIANGGEADALEIVYDDMHALYGGETLTLRAKGSLEAVWQSPPTDVRHTHTANLSADQVRAIAVLLISLHAWRQDVPEQTVPPDTTFSHVRIRVGSETSDVWELHDRMERLNQVQTALRAYVPGLAR